MLYHVSPTGGLKMLRPQKSSHGKAYVYATDDLITGLLFGAKKDDFDLMIFSDKDGIPVVYECYPDALKAVYKEKTCSVYMVDEEGFQKGLTSWEAELVCEQEVPVLKELIVEDLYERLLAEEANGKVKLHRYAHDDAYKKQIAGHITDRLIRFDVDLDHCMEKDVRFAIYYREIVQALRSVMDGHLLP